MSNLDVWVPALASILVAAIAAVTAYWIATRVYRTQKSVDAEAWLAKERKAAFRDYFEAAANLHTELRAALYRGDVRKLHLEKAEEYLHDVYRLQDMLAFNAGEDAIRKCRDYTISLLALRAYTRSEVLGLELTKRYRDIGSSEAALQAMLSAREAAMIAARSDVLGETDKDSRKALEGLMERKDISEEIELARKRDTSR